MLSFTKRQSKSVFVLGMVFSLCAGTGCESFPDGISSGQPEVDQAVETGVSISKLTSKSDNDANNDFRHGQADLPVEKPISDEDAIASSDDGMDSNDAAIDSQDLDDVTTSPYMTGSDEDELVSSDDGMDSDDNAIDSESLDDWLTLIESLQAEMPEHGQDPSQPDGVSTNIAWWVLPAIGALGGAAGLLLSNRRVCELPRGEQLCKAACWVDRNCSYDRSSCIYSNAHSRYVCQCMDNKGKWAYSCK